MLNHLTLNSRCFISYSHPFEDRQGFERLSHEAGETK